MSQKLPHNAPEKGAPTESDDEAQIRALIEDWAAAMRAKDLDRVLADHVDDIVMFDVPPPAELRGEAAYRESWPPFFEWQRRNDGVFEIISLEVTAGADVAFAHALLWCGARAEAGTDPDSRLRLTIGLRKQDGRSRVAHEHHSFPLQPSP